MVNIDWSSSIFGRLFSRSIILLFFSPFHFILIIWLLVVLYARMFFYFGLLITYYWLLIKDHRLLRNISETTRVSINAIFVLSLEIFNPLQFKHSENCVGMNPLFSSFKIAWYNLVNDIPRTQRSTYIMY